MENKTILVRPPVEIFDHSTDCEDINHKCMYLMNASHFCNIFNDTHLKVKDNIHQKHESCQHTYDEALDNKFESMR